jgi:hypothetical protein
MAMIRRIVQIHNVFRELACKNACSPIEILTNPTPVQFGLPLYSTVRQATMGQRVYYQRLAQSL